MGKRKEKVREKKEKKEKVLSWYVIVLMVLVASLIMCGIYAISHSFIKNKYKYPKQKVYAYEESGRAALDLYKDSLHDVRKLSDDSYLKKEISYANKNAFVEKFIQLAVDSVSYTVDMVDCENIYGNKYVEYDPELGTDVVRQEKSKYSVGEELTFTAIDYESVEIDNNLLKDILDDEELAIGDVDYQNRLVQVFCRYMLRLESVPMISIRRVVDIEQSGKSYRVLPTEDVFLDRYLFSSEEFYTLLNRFSKAAGDLTGEETLMVSDEWEAWYNLADDKRPFTIEPPKYGVKNTISKNWIGAYHLLNEYEVLDENGNKVKQVVDAHLGDGTFIQPASLHTPCVTSVFYGGKEYPIRVELIQFGVSQEAIEFFESKSIKNRGLSVKSDIQYFYAVFRVTNLSSSTIEIKDNSSLADDRLNTYTRTGELFGMIDSVVLNPDETALIETWGKSQELYKKYLIWGLDFSRRADPIWFRVLAGDLEDISENKGVYVN